MSWNHRIARRVFRGRAGTEEFLSVYEVYYDDDGRPNGITSNACAPVGGTLDELRGELARMLAATGQPILDYDEIAKPPSVPPMKMSEIKTAEDCLIFNAQRISASRPHLRCISCNMPEEDGTLWAVDQVGKSCRLLCGSCLRRGRDAGEKLVKQVCKIIEDDVDDGGKDWQTRLTDAVIEHDKAIRSWKPTDAASDNSSTHSDDEDAG